MLAACALPLTWAVVWAVRLYALRRNVLDHPNERSSHMVPTPRGGGAGVVAGAVAVGGAAVLAAGAEWALVAAAAFAIICVAIVGWCDDHTPLPVSVRLAIHLTSALLVAAIAVAAGVPTFGSDHRVAWMVLAACWWTFWTVSAINVVNFIDGIDGLVGTQFAVFGAYVAFAAPPTSPAGAFGIAITGASIGFLMWNWSPAKIFLGDVGSGAYGVIAVLAGIALLAQSQVTLVQAFLPLSAIFLDATVTLLRRARAGARLTVAHRSHLYQRLANGPWSHRLTASVYAAAAAGGAAVSLFGSAAWAQATGVGYIVVLAFVGHYLEVRYAPWRGDSPASA